MNKQKPDVSLSSRSLWTLTRLVLIISTNFADFFFEKWTLHGKLPRTIQLNQTKDKTATSGQKTSGFEFGPKYERFCWRFSYLVPSMFYTSFEQKKKQKTKNKEKPSEIMKQSRASYKIVNRVQNRRFSPWSRYAADPQPVRWLR